MSKLTVAILAPTGMLGSMVYKELKSRYNLILVYRNARKLAKLYRSYGRGDTRTKAVRFDFAWLLEDYLTGFEKKPMAPETKKIMPALSRADFIINCAGITKPRSLLNPTVTMFVNGFLPLMLGKLYREKLIQIATDCVYNGLIGAPYAETALKSPNDLYGLTKSIGEPEESLVLRTSIIGPQIDGADLLLEWFKKQRRTTVSGFTNHRWNGITTKQFARVCDQIMTNRSRYPKKGLFHIYGSTLTKYEMLKQFEQKYRRKVIVQPVKAPVSVDRRLTSRYDFNMKLHIPDFDTMLAELE